MNRVVWTGLALFLLTMISVPSARADSYRPAFTCEGGCAHGAAVFRNVSFYLVADLQHHAAHRFAPRAHEKFRAGDQGDNDKQGDDNNNGQGSMGTPPVTNSGSDMGSSGSSSATPVATPEPSTAALMLLGVGLLILTRAYLVSSAPRNP